MVKKFDVVEGCFVVKDKTGDVYGKLIEGEKANELLGRVFDNPYSVDGITPDYDLISDYISISPCEVEGKTGLLIGFEWNKDFMGEDEVIFDKLKEQMLKSASFVGELLGSTGEVYMSEWEVEEDKYCDVGVFITEGFSYDFLYVVKKLVNKVFKDCMKVRE
jgi:hypothetical protein